MKIEIEERFSEAKCLLHPNKLFIFGDNLFRVGKGGQAIIRDCKNAIGIATKDSIDRYMSDSNFFEYSLSIMLDIQRIKDEFNDKSNNYDTIVFPKNGLGTGLSNMQVKCPRTFLFLSQVLLEEFRFNNLANLKSE